jgi:hypothetical protein
LWLVLSPHVPSHSVYLWWAVTSWLVGTLWFGIFPWMGARVFTGGIYVKQACARHLLVLRSTAGAVSPLRNVAMAS